MMTDPTPMGRKMKPTMANTPTSLWTQTNATGPEININIHARNVKHGELPD